MLLQLKQRKFCSIHIQTLQEKCRFHAFHPSQILYISLTPKICTWLAEQFCTFHPSLHESVTPVAASGKKLNLHQNETRFNEL